MSLKFAHLQDQGINFVIFDADAQDRSQTGRSRLLAQLTTRVRANGLRVDKAALAYVEFGNIHFFGTRDLVDYLASGWSPHWTHTLDV